MIQTSSRGVVVHAIFIAKYFLRQPFCHKTWKFQNFGLLKSHFGKVFQKVLMENFQLFWCQTIVSDLYFVTLS